MKKGEMYENLNLNDLRRTLSIKALNKKGTVESAAKAMGISSRQLHRYILKFGIRKQKNEYIFINNT